MKTPTAGGFKLGGGNRAIVILLGLLILFVVLMAAVFFYVNSQSSNQSRLLSLVADQRLVAQQLATASAAASKGQRGAFVELERLGSSFNARLRSLELGDDASGLPAAPAALRAPISKVSGSWSKYRKNIDTVTRGRQAIESAAGFVDAIDGALPGLAAGSDELVKELAKANASARQIDSAARQLQLVERMRSNVYRILAGGDGGQTAAATFGRDAKQFGQMIDGLSRGLASKNLQAVESPAAQRKLRELSSQFNPMAENVGEVLKLSPEVFEVTSAVAQLEIANPTLLRDTEALQTEARNQSEGLGILNVIGFLLGALALLTLVLGGWQVVRDARRRLEQTTEQNQRNQRAILRLLDEMTNLAEGDLTINATVTEDITGAIADSVNYAIEALRSLVATINQTVVQVSAAAQKTQGTTQRLADASNYQAREIASASAAITDMADSIEQVSKNALTSAEVAQKSVAIAHKGAQTVSRTIDGMDTIREQIQETSKRIKRLGESSQEIGDIVSLINEIADQTNILALNAAIQASTAGEAGRGFAVVADEVQRLAERASNATKQIEALVKTIQADTNEAVISMEQSTSNVVGGAKLAEDAGDALGEIESVSDQLAQLIQSISQSARQQASAAANITNTMNVIQEITMQTSEGTSETASSVANLTGLANELRRSVAGFKLPGNSEADTMVMDLEEHRIQRSAS